MQPTETINPLHTSDLALRCCCLALLVIACTRASAAVTQLPPVERTAQQRKELEAKLDWFYQAKYGIGFHFVPNMHRFRTGRIKWTSEKWNAWVDAVDVEKVATQAEEVGAGYVAISLGQGGGYYCSPNPIIQKYWNCRPGEFGSTRDLPMDLHHALKKRGIRMMLYTGCTPYMLPGPASEKAGWYGKGYKFGRATPEGANHWIEVLQWYSDHYGEAVSGWWLDGLREWAPDYRQRVHAAVKHGNPDSITTSATHALSDYIHGHCTANWRVQQKRLPANGRWESEYGIQWHAFQYLGHSWAANGTARSTDSLVNYAVKVIQGGGVITFDIGTFDERPVLKGPYLSIRKDQMQQLRSVRDAVSDLDTKEQGR